MTKASFERIDYQLRYNKHIERKIVFDLLGKARQVLDLTNHRYLGFGSMWFADFRLAHRVLELQTMFSMERPQFASRAKFNAPYRSISVLGQASSQAIAAFDWSHPVIAWLDYDGTLETSVSADIKTILENCAPNSVVLVTLNAVRSFYRPSKGGGKRDRIDTALGQVEAMLAPGVVAPRFEPAGVYQSHGDVAEELFPSFLAEAMLSFMMHVVASASRLDPSDPGGDPIEFRPLVNICHKDGADMITVGGALVGSDKARWQNEVADDLVYPENSNIPTHVRLDLVPLTLKEKLVLDSCLPNAVQQDFVQRAKDSGVCLTDDDLSKYWQHHNHFPVFFETSL
jgi:hypothetical protein